MASRLYVFTYLGSKLRMINEIEYLAPTDATELYEVCGGLGAFVINQHSLYKKAVYNELNPIIYNLMHVIKHKGISYAREIIDLKCDRPLFDKVKGAYLQEFAGIEGPMERALGFSLLQLNSYNGNRIAYVEKNRSKTWKENTRKRIERASRELQSIELENRDCMDILSEQRFNDKAFILLDVPYPVGKETERVTKAIYEDFDWSDEMHDNAVRILRDMDGRIGCKVMVCTYQSDIYDSLIETGNWIRVKIKDIHSPAGKKGKKRKRKIECVYLNYSSYSPLAKYQFDIDESRQSRQK